MRARVRAHVWSWALTCVLACMLVYSCVCACTVQDSRFNPDFDRASGYRTKSILCMPLLGIDGTLVGVIQLINKVTGGAFDVEDEDIMGSFLGMAAPIIQVHSRVTYNTLSVVQDILLCV
jgi:hypothetical protein